MASRDPPEWPDRRENTTSPPHQPPSIISAIRDIPRTIFDHGAEHGREWRRVCNRDEKTQNDKDRNQSAESYTDKRWHCRRERARQRAAEGAAAKEASEHVTDRKPEPFDWYEWTRRELEQGEKRAKELYDSFEADSRAQKNNNASSQSPRPPTQSLPTDDGWQGWPFSQLDSFVRQVFNDHSPHHPNTAPTAESLFDRAMRDLSHPAAILQSIFPQPGVWPILAPPNFGNVAAYAAFDEYSPLNLAQQSGFDNTWRARFEDLIRAEQGVKMLSAWEARESTMDNVEDWVFRFLVRPSEPQKAAIKPAETRATPYLGFGNEDRSELDAYEHFLSGSSEQPVRPLGEGQKDGPVSVFRTVDSYTQADGSTTMKSVTRKTYADGRVENIENVETIPAKAEAIAPRAEGKPTSQPTPQKKKGWFWSS
jgi:hypothetical protein